LQQEVPSPRAVLDDRRHRSPELQLFSCQGS